MTARTLIRDAMVSVYDGRVCVGHLRRIPAGTEAFDFNEHSLGVFENDDTAAAAVWRHARGAKASGGSTP
jgi:hypothetical protein